MTTLSVLDRSPAALMQVATDAITAIFISRETINTDTALMPTHIAAIILRFKKEKLIDEDAQAAPDTKTLGQLIAQFAH